MCNYNDTIEAESYICTKNFQKALRRRIPVITESEFYQLLKGDQISPPKDMSHLVRVLSDEPKPSSTKQTPKTPSTTPKSHHNNSTNHHSSVTTPPSTPDVDIPVPNAKPAVKVSMSYYHTDLQGPFL